MKNRQTSDGKNLAMGAKKPEKREEFFSCSYQVMFLLFCFFKHIIETLLIIAVILFSFGMIFTINGMIFGGVACTLWAVQFKLYTSFVKKVDEQFAFAVEMDMGYIKFYDFIWFKYFEFRRVRLEDIISAEMSFGRFEKFMTMSGFVEIDQHYFKHLKITIVDESGESIIYVFHLVRNKGELKRELSQLIQSRIISSSANIYNEGEKL